MFSNEISVRRETTIRRYTRKVQGLDNPRKRGFIRNLELFRLEDPPAKPFTQNNKFGNVLNLCNHALIDYHSINLNTSNINWIINFLISLPWWKWKKERKKENNWLRLYNGLQSLVIGTKIPSPVNVRESPGLLPKTERLFVENESKDL